MQKMDASQRVAYVMMFAIGWLFLSMGTLSLIFSEKTIAACSFISATIVFLMLLLIRKRGYRW